MGLRRELDDLDRRFRARPGEDGAEPLSFGKHALLLLGMVALLMLPAMAILLVQTVRAELKDNRARAALESDGAVVTGTVTKLRFPNRWNVFPSAARVAFTTEAGDHVATWVPVSHAPDEGTRIKLRYSRRDPSVARVPGDETPNRGRWKLIAIGGPVFSVAFVAVTTSLERARRRREGKPSYWTGGPPGDDRG